MSIAILMATYNGEKYLAEQLQSILNQTFQDWHLMIRDDGSSDQTVKILKEFKQRHPNRLTLLASDPSERLGVVANFGRLLASTAADYYAFADQDDVWHPQKLAQKWAKMKSLERKNPGIPLLVHSDAVVVDQNLKLIDPSFWRYSALFPARRNQLKDYLVQNNVTGCCMLINRSLRDKAIPIPSEALMHDWWLALVASGLGQVVCLPKASLSYRQHSNNVLGAQKFWSILFQSKWKARYRKSLEMEPRKVRQAEIFAERYQSSLGKKRQLAMLYPSLGKMKWWKSKWLTLKYGLLKNGFCRSLLWFLLRKQP